MNDLLRFLTRYEILFYIFTGVIILVYVRKVILAWREWSLALFGLEKETAQRKINGGLSIIFFSTLLGIGLFVTNTFVTPSVPGVFQLATPTIDLTAQPTQAEATATAQLPDQGLIPTLSSMLDKGCIPGQIDWSYPLDGDGISGSVELKGTVNIPNLGYYKIGYASLDQDNWKEIVSNREIVVKSSFGSLWNTRELTPGEYRLRLAVFTNQQEALPECTITVLVKAIQQ